MVGGLVEHGGHWSAAQELLQLRGALFRMAVWYRLEVATGSGCVLDDITYARAVHLALLEGLQVAKAHGVTHLEFASDSKAVIRQLLHVLPEKGPVPSSPRQPQLQGAGRISTLKPILQLVGDHLDEVAVTQMQRWCNGLAIIQAELALELLLLLLKIPAAPPSRYSHMATLVGTLLQLPMAVRRNLEAADDFADSVAQDSVSVNQLVSNQVFFTMRRIFSPQEGAAYAAAAAASASIPDLPNPTECVTGAAGSQTARQQLQAAGLSQVQDMGHSSRLLGGRVVGRHRLTHRLLELSSEKQHSSAPQSFGSEAAEAAGDVLDDGAAAGDSMLLNTWLPTSRAASTSEGAGLGEQRYQLPQVSSDMATHLLQFDGASKNNPGRAGYGYVLFDLTSGKMVGRGCMTLPYGCSAGRAECEGLIAGLQAAQDAGISSLAVQGDSTIVLDAMMFRRGITGRELYLQYHKASKLLMGFQHVDFQYICRNQNSLADRLANISMDLDTALFAVLRTDSRGLDGLRMINKAARMGKKSNVMELMLSTYSFPLLLVVMLERIMSLSPEHLLSRLRSKAAVMGDPNPWLVQEVAKLVTEGIPEQVKAEVGGLVMDSRFNPYDVARLRKAAVLRQQEQQHNAAIRSAAAGSWQHNRLHKTTL
eukprot:gene4362-4615_t